MLKPIIALIAFCAAALSPAFADEPTKELELAHELLKVIGGADMYNQLFDVSINAAFSEIETQSPKAKKEDLEVFREEFTAAIREEIDTLIDETAKIYERNLSVEEMQASLEFYRSPAGQSMLKKLPVITGEAMTLGAKFSKTASEKAYARAIERTRKRGVEL